MWLCLFLVPLGSAWCCCVLRERSPWLDDCPLGVRCWSRLFSFVAMIFRSNRRLLEIECGESAWRPSFLYTEGSSGVPFMWRVWCQKIGKAGFDTKQTHPPYFFPSLANKGARTTATVKRVKNNKNGLRLAKQQQVGKCLSHSFLNCLYPPLVKQ